jgi:16S rRNA (cytosine1402-N4)-methyltransferase
MTEPAPEKPPRRPRYSGKNPQRFEDKYKEHAPDRYADEVAKVLAAGKTPAGTHRPILVQEILDVLEPLPGQTVVDCTIGYGGHAQRLLAAVNPHGRLIGIDADPIESPKTEARLRSLEIAESSLSLHLSTYDHIRSILDREGLDSVDMILADLGLSSMQIDDPSRGFSFKANGPLDMRMNPGEGLSASDWLSTVNKHELAQILEDNADEPHSAVVAEAIIRANFRSKLKTTDQLGDVVRSQYRAEDAEDAVRRVFQAIRIAVNREYERLDALLAALPLCLKSGGRVAILTFHSGEDRRVKAAFKQGHADGLYREIAREIIRPSVEERRSNPRSTSAKLRYAVRV